MPTGNLPEEHAAIVVLTFAELEKTLALPETMHITHAQVRGLAPELFLRLEDTNLPEVSPEKGARIASGTLILDTNGSFERLEL